MNLIKAKRANRKRQFTPEQRTEILRVAAHDGRRAVIDRYGVTDGMLSAWRKKARAQGCATSVAEAIAYLRHARSAMPPAGKLRRHELLTLLALDALGG